MRSRCSQRSTHDRSSASVMFSRSEAEPSTSRVFPDQSPHIHPVQKATNRRALGTRVPGVGGCSIEGFSGVDIAAATSHTGSIPHGRERFDVSGAR